MRKIINIISLIFALQGVWYAIDVEFDIGSVQTPIISPSSESLVEDSEKR